MRGMRVPFWQQPCAMNVSTRSHELIMVMGAQRSGTNVLFSSLATDRTLSAFPEDIDSAFYCNFLLRPLSELAPLIERAPRRILLKPITETGRRSLTELAEEYRSYPLRFVWIYRDPVNVFDSMRRERWLAANEIDQPAQSRGWCKHNEYALQFQQECPEQIGIVRYEDLCFDRAVFRQLTRWLDLDCNSYFRKDTAQGRKHVPVVAQRNIDARTKDTLAALDAARTFSPRRAFLLKRRIVTYLRESLKPHPTAPEAGGAEAEAHSQIVKVAEAARPPSAVPGLHFWLNSAAICHSNGLLTTDVVECGPYRMVAARPDNGPYGLLSLLYRGTLFYPHTKTEERRRGASGTLCFGAGHDWNFFFDNNGFSVFALFRPNLPCYPPYNQQYCTLFRVGARSIATPAFFLAWDGLTNSSSARVVSSPQQRPPQTRAISTRPQSHRPQEWALITVQRAGGANGQFSISANGILGDSIDFAGGFSSQPDDGCVLELGGFTAERAELFYGKVAELVIFKGALGSDDSSEITRYLTEKHRL
jgi:hypothetical protein